MCYRAHVSAAADRSGVWRLHIGQTNRNGVPFTEAVLSAIVGAAQDMLVRVLSEEFADTYGRINESLVCPYIGVRKRAHDPPEGLVDDWKGTVTAWLASEEAAPVRGATIRFVEGQSIIPDDIIS